LSSVEAIEQQPRPFIVRRNDHRCQTDAETMPRPFVPPLDRRSVLSLRCSVLSLGVGREIPSGISLGDRVVSCDRRLDTEY